MWHNISNKQPEKKDKNHQISVEHFVTIYLFIHDDDDTTIVYCFVELMYVPTQSLF